ncbi:AAA family ATPase [Hymenobacter ginsengisoli]|uniref:AAA family ATPase n=1 Tax=Hymenobacter ginsengisoli TaxID=1051626 RepID=A0ABP8QBS2_9BACT|nr:MULTISPECIES: ATP-binding protein [unclassified Hymenobacter]MBO2031492.1 ATP-binding protein [Hymenobacter sp. BT559]
MRRISLTGPESSGKSTLARQLAAHYGTVFVPEYARQYLEENGPGYTLADLEAIAHGQLAAEDAAASQATGLLVCDTDLLVIKIWAENAFGTCPGWVLEELARPRYALTLLLAPDLPWTPDPLREHPDPAQRWHFYELYRQELAQRNWPFVEINGLPEQRLTQAVAAVATLPGKL